MVQIVNIVFTAEMGCPLDLRHITNSTVNIIYRPKRPNAAIWKHRRIKSTCLLYASGKIVCTGSKSVAEGRKDIRQYARMLQKMDYNIRVKNISVRNCTAIHSLLGTLNLPNLVTGLDARYEPELFPAAMLKREGVHYTCFHTGKILITGFKSTETLDEVIYPTLLELELLTN